MTPSDHLPGPPARAERLLEAWLPPEEAEAFLGDLAERHAACAAAAGTGAAARAYWMETIRAILAFAPHRLRRRTAARSGDAMPTLLLADLRFGARLLARAPGFTAVTLLTLALGIGATTAIVSVVHPVLIAALPYPEGDRIHTIWETDPGGDASTIGYATFADLASRATGFSALAAMSFWSPTAQGDGEAEQLNGQRVTWRFFDVLGVAPALGRSFTADDDVRGQHLVTILSHGLWQRRYGGDSSLIGRTITLSGTSYRVIGIMPARFENLFNPRAQLWAPLAYNSSLSWACRTCRHLRAAGRLAPGVAPATAATELNRIAADLQAAFSTEYFDAGMQLIPLRTIISGPVRPALLALAGAVALVLLIACANVMNLLLARAAHREREFAIRTALGAARGRVTRQLVAESLLLAGLGGALGIALAWAGLRALLAMSPASLPRIEAVGLNGPVLVLTLVLVLGTGLIFGLGPAFAAGRGALSGALRQGARTAHGARHRLRSALVISEVALSLMLLLGAGLLIRSMQRVLEVDPGYEPQQLLTFQAQAAGARYDSDTTVRAYFTQALATLRTLPGVSGAAAVTQLPLGGNFDAYGIYIESQPLDNPALAPGADRYVVTPDYLPTMGIAVVRGRGLTAADDRPDAPPVVLINETFARRHWAGRDPLGDRLQMGGADTPWRSIVGIVRDVRHSGLDLPQSNQFYVPTAQWPWADNGMTLVVRTAGDPAALAPAALRAVRALDPGNPLSQVATMEQVMHDSLMSRRFALRLFAVFATVALILAAAGIYGVLAAAVSERTREIGIRTALGASRRATLGLVLRQTGALAGAGIVLGLLGAAALVRFLGSLLYEVAPSDPLTFLTVTLILGAVAIVAAAVPAVRAARVDPIIALRSE